jgi:2-C-methyl-D-erythritol 4-phosphate cytidylyltransferase
MRKVIAVVPAAGFGRRFGAGTNKPFITLLDKPLVVWALETLQATKEIAEIIPVFKESDMEEGVRIVEDYGLSKVKRIAPGGKERQDSVYNGLKLITDKSAVVLIHDGARPLVDKTLIRNTIKGLEGYDGAVAALPPKDTIKETDENGDIRKTLKRQSLWAVQTPQVFYYKRIMDAYEKAMKEGFYSTDDSALVERQGGRIRVVMGSYKNIKITTPEDLDIAELFLKKAGF